MLLRKPNNTDFIGADQNVVNIKEKRAPNTWKHSSFRWRGNILYKKTG